jgi:hypothetical protein
MKGKLIALASILCIASLMASGANAGKPDKPLGKPDKPGNTQTEWIGFTGNFVGGEEVEGCCPNAGPFPEYTLALKKDLVFSNGNIYPIGTYDGQVFMNGDKFQFWTEGWPNDHICIEIYGGVEDYDRKAKVLTVTFDDVEWNAMHEDLEKTPIGLVSFVLTRIPTRYCTPEICPE